ncbi:hypothetical protein R0131_07270 [Clostridium sp. AL.422]|uniref:DUF6873 family GME fold protein n=1 Tax=Clostridium TaxID=1485 RepID=UPI00293DCA2A|nr:MULTISPECIES: hypothetical protein [unclassified Clostridium]MDV4150633.1 hypothetical protein [Clostridium sp. AL.422]
MICFIDYRTTTREKEALNSLNLNIIEIPKCHTVYEAINGHADIQMNILDKKLKKIIINRNIDENFKKKLSDLNIKYIESENSLKETYPSNIFLNALILEDYFVHNLNYSDKNLLKYQTEKTLINVKQGYTKCSCLPVNNKALITSDIGIYKVLSKYGFDILLIPPGDIILKGLNYGFIGGSGGLINDETMAFFGNLKYYKYGYEVKAFLKKHNVNPIYLSDEKLHDRGSIFII